MLLVAVCLVGWPASCLTIARDEPPVILGLSWIAIVIAALDVWSTQDVRKEQEGER